MKIVAGGLLALATFLEACTTAATGPVQKSWVLADTHKYKTEQEVILAKQLAENDCKVKAISASGALRKQSGEKQDNLGTTMRLREDANALYDATFAACMNKAGYIQQ